jgi:hypothetical protein
MNNGVVVYKDTQIPEKDLLKNTSYSYFPSTTVRDQIINDVKKNLKCDLEDYSVGIEVIINLKEYKKPTNDTKNT